MAKQKRQKDSEIVNRKTDNTMTKQNDKTTSNGQQKYYKEN